MEPASTLSLERELNNHCPHPKVSPCNSFPVDQGNSLTSELELRANEFVCVPFKANVSVAHTPFSLSDIVPASCYGDFIS